MCKEGQGRGIGLRQEEVREGALVLPGGWGRWQRRNSVVPCTLKKAKVMLERRYRRWRTFWLGLASTEGEES